MAPYLLLQSSEIQIAARRIDRFRLHFAHIRPFHHRWLSSNSPSSTRGPSTTCTAPIWGQCPFFFYFWFVPACTHVSDPLRHRPAGSPLTECYWSVRCRPGRKSGSGIHSQLKSYGWNEKWKEKRERELSLFTNLDIKKKLENILVVDQLPRKWSNSVSNAEAGSKLARAFFFLSLFFHRQVGHLTVLSYQRINDQAVSGDWWLRCKRIC